MNLPGIDRTDLVIYEKSARHHHENMREDDDDDDDDEGLLPIDYRASFLVLPERLGVRLRIIDEVPRGTVVVDVAVIFEWDRPATPDDDLDEFAIETGIPQALNSAATLLVATGESVGTAVPFYGLEDLEEMRDRLRNDPEPLTVLLAKHIEQESAQQDASTD
jgi:hypothetical protein